MNINELIPGEVYDFFTNGYWSIVKIADKIGNKNPNLQKSKPPLYTKDGFTLSIHFSDKVKLSSKKDKKWLEACIKANKYVECPKEEIDMEAINQFIL